MKKILYSAVALICFGFLSCDGNKTGSSTTETDSSSTTTTMSDTAGAMNNSGNGSSDTSQMTGSNNMVTNKDVTDFVEKAASGGMMEVELGNMAATNAQSDRVKAFGAMMVSDHTAAGNELKQMATSNNISAPSMMMPDHQKHVDMLKSKTGAAFDKAYMDMMVKDHKEDIAQYKKASTELSVQAYKDFASKTLPTLQKHLDSAQVVNKSLR